VFAGIAVGLPYYPLAPPAAANEEEASVTIPYRGQPRS
jgi:hypothetical protein